MNWEDVEAFRAVAATLSFTAAAQNLHVGRPVVSRRVQRLERSVGTALFIRSTRWVRLTPAGARLLRATEEMLCTWRDALADVRSGGNAIGQLRIALHTNDVVRVVQALSAAFPGSSWQTQAYREQESLTALEAGELDVVTGYSTPEAGLPAPDRARVEPLVEEPVWVAVAPGGRLAGRRGGLRAVELRHEAWIAHPLPVLRQLLDDVGRRGGFEPDVRHITGDRSAIRTLVGSGAAVSLAAPIVAPDSDLALVPLLDGPKRTIFIAYRLDAFAGQEAVGARLVGALRSWYAVHARQSPQYWRFITAHPERFPGLVD